jgi:hypothetical protein
MKLCVDESEGPMSITNALKATSGCYAFRVLIHLLK